MNADQDEWDAEVEEAYSNFLLQYQGPELQLHNGDDLILAMERGALWADFLADLAARRR